MTRHILRSALLAVILLSHAASANDPALPPVDVDLELVLAVDVSGSIDGEESKLQRNGFAAAITNEHILKAVQSGPLRRVAVMYLEWSGLDRHRVVADWTIIENDEDAKDFAEKISGAAHFRGHWTSISSVIDESLMHLNGNNIRGVRRVIDISGDGVNNNGDGVVEARDRAVRNGVTINGLPIINGRIGPQGLKPLPNLDLYYRDCVIGGQGAFIVIARGFADFARAIRRKMFLELSGWSPPLRRVPVQFQPEHRGQGKPYYRPRADCMAGEKRTLKELQDLNRILNRNRKAH